MSLRCPTVADLLFTFVIGPVCDVAQTSDGGISFKALSVMSLRRPTVVFLLSPLCDVAQTSDCGISFKALYVMSPRRLTVAFILSPLCGVT